MLVGLAIWGTKSVSGPKLDSKKLNFVTGIGNILYEDSLHF